MAEFVRGGDGSITINAALPVSVDVCSASIVRIRVGGSGDREWTYVDAGIRPIHGEQCSGAVDCDAASVTTESLALHLRGDPQCLEFCDRAGHVLLRLAPGDWRLGVDASDGNGAGAGVGTGARLRLHFVGEQHFYGMGQGGAFDRLGVSRRLWNSHVNHACGSDIAIPLLVSSAGYALFFDNSSLARLEAGDSDSATWLDYACESDSLDLYFLCGDGMRGALVAATDLLGRAPMPPRWSLGYLQSTRHFDSPDELRRLPAMFREKQLPCDALFLLSSYGDALGWNKGVGWLDWHPKLAPDHGSLVDEFHACDFHVIAHEYPVLHPDSPLYADALAQGFLLDDGYPDTPTAARTPVTYTSGQRFIDFSQAAAREWWWAQHAALVGEGIDGWWLDGGEGPTAGNARDARAGTSASLHNRYDLLRFRAFAEGEARERPDLRPFLLCRSGGAGMQRFGAGTWTGDVNNTFSTLEAQIAMGLNVGMSGVPYWGTDVGGYYPTVEASAELFVRWFQFGVFCPIFRAHGRAWRERLPWAYGSEIEGICRRFLELRYRLLPYTYTLAWHAHRDGLPLMRPLVLNHAADPRTWDLATEFLWGDDILVAPVTREGATHWPVYLPKGRWHDFWTHAAYEGPCSVTVDAPLDRLPLFVRAGALLPLGPALQHLSGPPAPEVTLLTYPAPIGSDALSGACTLYDDDGTTNGYRQGDYTLTGFECSATSAALVCRVGSPRGAALPKNRTYTFQIFSPPAPWQVALEGGTVLPQGRHTEGEAWWHDGKFLFVRLGSGPAAVSIVW